MNNIIIINDCRDGNAAGRQLTRAGHLFNSTPIFIGVSTELEAAGNLIDMIDALDGAEGVILVNVAPRHGEAKKWENGVPFSYFHYGKTLVCSTIDGPVLSLVKKLQLTTAINVLDTASVTKKMVSDAFLPSEIEEQIIKSQFRSFDFLPRVAAYIKEGNLSIGDSMEITTFPDSAPVVWHVDNFGNCKTTLFSEEIGFKAGESVETKMGKLPCYARLKDVPHHEVGIIIGSSGLGEKRFLEIVIQGKSAAEHFGLQVGSLIV